MCVGGGGGGGDREKRDWVRGRVCVRFPNESDSHSTLSSDIPISHMLKQVLSVFKHLSTLCVCVCVCVCERERERERERESMRAHARFSFPVPEEWGGGGGGGGGGENRPRDYTAGQKV